MKRGCEQDEDAIQVRVIEAEYYGVSSTLKSAIAALPLDELSMKDKSMLLLSGCDFPFARLANREDGSVIVSHDNKTFVYDWALRTHHSKGHNCDIFGCC
ncbi:hypothetical protein SUGI_1082970 [Cryptomeria japonica]|nr:hypothetical protein SUGI_1082970 [Cryptomeria japonica]